MDDIVIIIVTFDGESLIKPCLDSIFSGQVIPEIVIVDNASSDNTCTIIESEFPQVTLLKNIENTGFAEANNKAINYALKRWHPKFFMLLNQDVTIKTDTVEKLVSAHENNPAYGILSPLHMSPDGSLDYLFEEYHKHTIQMSESMITDIKFVNAAAWCVSRACIETVGGFDTSLFTHYGEDDHYIHRVFYHGLRVGILSNISIVHHREKRADSDKKFWLNKLFIANLVQCANINYDEKYADYWYNSRRVLFLKSVVKSVVTFDITSFKWLFKAWFDGKIFLWKDVQKSRRINKLVGRNWLASSDDD